MTTEIHGHSIWARELTPSIILEVQEWRRDAACRDTDVALFFPERAGYAQAREFCSRCPVLLDCRRWADTAEGGSTRLFGLVGGESPRERVARRRLFLAERTS